jgi:hypothetical protein
MPAVILRLVIVVLMAFSSLSLNIQSVNADDDPTPPVGEETPTVIPGENPQAATLSGVITED